MTRKINASTVISSNDGHKSTEIERPAILSPSPNHRDYNRYKYYSALRTGFNHLNPEAADEAFLEVPLHVVDENLFLLMNPFHKPEDGNKASSMVIIFSCWKTMMGSAVVSMPWAI